MAQLNEDQFNQLLGRIGGGAGRKLPPFSSGDSNAWLEWRLTFNNVADLNNWNDDMCRRQLKAAMEGYAAAAVASIEIPDDATRRAALNLYEAKFVTPAASAAARQQFLTAKQREDESLTAWHTRLAALYRRSDPNGDHEQARELKERFIMGIAHPVVRERTYDANPDTMAACLTVASDKFATIAAVGADRQSHALAHRMGINNLQSGGGGNWEAKRTTSAVLKCYICNSAEHLKRDCPKNAGPKGKKKAAASTQRGGRRGPARPLIRRNEGPKAVVPYRIQALENDGNNNDSDTLDGGDHGAALGGVVDAGNL